MSTAFARTAFARTAFGLALVPALLTACADDPVSAYPLGPTETAAKPALAVSAIEIGTGCTGNPCKVAPARILFTDATVDINSTGTVWSVNPDGTGLRTESLNTRGATWMPGYGRYVAAWSGSVGSDLYAFTLGSALRQQRYTNDPASDIEPAVSPDGSRIAFASDRGSDNGEHEIFIVLTGQAPEVGGGQVTFDYGDVRSPHFSPDGKSLVYASNERIGLSLPQFHIYRKTFSVDAWVQLSSREGRHPVYSPDGSQIAFTTATPAGDRIAVMSANGDNPKILQNGLANSSQPSWSRDGTMIAFTSTDRAWKGIDVMRVDGTGVRHVAEFGSMPKWSR